MFYQGKPVSKYSITLITLTIGRKIRGEIKTMYNVAKNLYK